MFSKVLQNSVVTARKDTGAGAVAGLLTCLRGLQA